MQYCKFNPYDECLGGCKNCSRYTVFCEYCGKTIKSSEYLSLYGEAICNDCLFTTVDEDELISFARKNSEDFIEHLTTECKEYVLEESQIKKELYL